MSATISAGIDLGKCYHVYEMEWTATSLTSYLDGKPVEAKTCGTHLKDLFGKSQHIVLNLPLAAISFLRLTRQKLNPEPCM